jgi:hypothetical protein
MDDLEKERTRLMDQVKQLKKEKEELQDNLQNTE